jgi:hypothetical protein
VAAGPDDGTEDGEVVGDGAVPDGVAAGDELGAVLPLDWVAGLRLAGGVAGCLFGPWPPPPTTLPTVVPVECLPHTTALSGFPADSSMIVTTTMTARNRLSVTPP